MDTKLSLYFYFFHLAIKNYTSVIKKTQPHKLKFPLSADTSFSSVDVCVPFGTQIPIEINELFSPQQLLNFASKKYLDLSGSH